MTSKRGFIIGCIGAGAMGSAILKRLASDGGADDLIAFDIDENKTNALALSNGIRAAQSAQECARDADVVIVAVKPGTVPSVLALIKDVVRKNTVIVSIAAGVTLRELESILGREKAIVRAMPNTPALVGEGMTVLSPNNSENELLARVESIFSSLGRVMVLPETLMDAVTGLSGSGPAFVFTFISAMADAGVKLGIPRDKALVLAAQTVLGAAKYALESGEDPALLRSRVASPGGTTIEGIHVLERSGFSGIVMDAVEQAALKSKKLGGG